MKIQFINAIGNIEMESKHILYNLCCYYVQQMTPFFKQSMFLPVTGVAYIS